MFDKLFNLIASCFKCTIMAALLAAAAAAALTLAYLAIMTCYRLIGSTWTHLFSRPWP